MAENVLTVEIRDPGTSTSPRPQPSPQSFTSQPPATPTGQSAEMQRAIEDIQRRANTRRDDPTSPTERIQTREPAKERKDKPETLPPAMSEAEIANNQFVSDVRRRVTEAIRQAASIELDASKIPSPVPISQPVAVQKPQTPTRADADIELDASKPNRGPTFDPDAPNPPQPRKPTPITDDFELDASKGPRFSTPPVQASPTPIADPAADIELDATKAASAVRGAIDQDKPRWLKAYEDITERLANRLLTAEEAATRIDRLVSSRRDEITDSLRSSGKLAVGEDAAERLKADALAAAKVAVPVVERKPTPVAQEKSPFGDEFRNRLERDQINARSFTEDANKVLTDRKADSTANEQAIRERNERLASQAAAVNTGLRAGLQGGATAKVGAAVQIAGSGMLGAGPAAAAAGPIGIAALGAAAAVDTLAQAAGRAKQFLNDFAERGESLKGFSAEVSTASALATIDKLEADIREARASGKQFADAINARSQFDIAFREAMQPIERIGAKLMTAILQDLVPLVKKIGIAAEHIEGVFDLLTAIYEVITGQKGIAEAQEEFGEKLMNRIKMKDDLGNAPADLLENFFKGLDINLRPVGNDPAPPAQFGAALRGGQ